MNESTNKFASWDVIDQYFKLQEEAAPYHDRAILNKLVSILEGYYPGEHRHTPTKLIDGLEINESGSLSTYNIVNYYGIGQNSEHNNSNILLQLLHAEMGYDPKLMKNTDQGLELTYSGVMRINNVFNEMESHYLLFKPALWKTIIHFLRNNTIKHECFIDKNITIKGKSHQYEGIKLSMSSTEQATLQILHYMKALLLLEENISSNKTRNNILGHNLHFFERRLHMDLSDIYQKRNGLFGLIGKNLLGCDNRIVYDKKNFIVEEVANNTEFQDSQYKATINFIVIHEGKQVECILHGRTKSAKSINDKLESNPNYGYLDVMDDLFAFTITTLGNDDLQLVAGLFSNQFVSNRIGIMENDVDGLKLSVKGNNEIDFQNNIASMLHSDYKKQLFNNKYEQSGKKTKKVTSSLYKDYKAQLNLTNIDGHSCGCEVKFMTEKQFQESEKSDDLGSIAYKIKSKIVKDDRYEKILPAQYIDKFVQKLEHSEEFRGQKINPKKVKQYVKSALYTVKFSQGGEIYIGYIAKEYFDYFINQQLINDQTKVIDWIDPWK